MFLFSVHEQLTIFNVYSKWSGILEGLTEEICLSALESTDNMETIFKNNLIIYSL